MINHAFYVVRIKGEQNYLKSLTEATPERGQARIFMNELEAQRFANCFPLPAVTEGI